MTQIDLASSVRQIAQAVRHAPGLRALTPLWETLRVPYAKVMSSLASRRGFRGMVGDVHVRLHPDFATLKWETVELASYRTFSTMLRPGDIVYDVGAHIGTYTLVALDGIGPRGRVIAYEPHAFTRRYLEQHVVWNHGSERVVVRDLCCGAHRGRATFYGLRDRAEGMSGLLPVHAFEETTTDVTTLDEEVRLLGAIPNVIKIDVEGSEWDVLKGAVNTLRVHQPRLLLSLHPRALAAMGSSPADVLQWLSELRYTCRVVSEDHEIHVAASCRP